MSTGNLDVADKIIHPDFVGHVGEMNGIQGVKRFVAGTRAISPDFNVIEISIIAEGDLVCFITYPNGTFADDYAMETPVDEFGITQIGLHRVADEKIVAYWLYSSDSLTLYQSFGYMSVQGEFSATEPWDIARGESNLSPEEQRAIVEDLIADFFNAQNMDIALQFFAEDAVIHAPPSTSVEALDLTALQDWMSDL